MFTPPLHVCCQQAPTSNHGSHSAARSHDAYTYLATTAFQPAIFNQPLPLTFGILPLRAGPWLRASSTSNPLGKDERMFILHWATTLEGCEDLAEIDCK